MQQYDTLIKEADAAANKAGEEVLKLVAKIGNLVDDR